uniref:UBA domain-containing protein n=1 Tax=Zooxanthella nutricula TaxID=1333877 RepID=A0A7S2M403_9DINO
MADRLTDLGFVLPTMNVNDTCGANFLRHFAAWRLEQLAAADTSSLAAKKTKQLLCTPRGLRGKGCESAMRLRAYDLVVRNVWGQTDEAFALGTYFKVLVAVYSPEDSVDPLFFDRAFPAPFDPVLNLSPVQAEKLYGPSPHAIWLRSRGVHYDALAPTANQADFQAIHAEEIHCINAGLNGVADLLRIQDQGESLKATFHTLVNDVAEARSKPYRLTAKGSRCEGEGYADLGSATHCEVAARALGLSWAADEIGFASGNDTRGCSLANDHKQRVYFYSSSALPEKAGPEYSSVCFENKEARETVAKGAEELTAQGYAEGRALKALEGAGFKVDMARSALIAEDERKNREAERKKAVDEMCSRGHARPDVERCLKAANDDPDRAMEYLTSGIPEDIAIETGTAADNREARKTVAKDVRELIAQDCAEGRALKALKRAGFKVGRALESLRAEDEIRNAMMAMGFPRPDVEWGLKAANGDPDLAAYYIVEDIDPSEIDTGGA